MNISDFALAVELIMTDIALFSHAAGGIKLRAYQEEVARAVIDSVLHQRGLTFVVNFPRQSGKNELQAQIEAYLLLCFQQDGECVKISPTWKPQSLNAMRRLERALEANALVRLVGWKKEQGYVYRVGSSRLYFLSGAPTAHIVGATASVLLECDEAQDVQIAKWDKEVVPMAASTNATRVFWGTAWTSQTLLARQKQAALEAQKADGIRRGLRPRRRRRGAGSAGVWEVRRRAGAQAGAPPPLRTHAVLLAGSRRRERHVPARARGADEGQPFPANRTGSKSHLRLPDRCSRRG